MAITSPLTPSTTFPSTVFVSTTDDQGRATTTAPSQVMLTVTLTESGKISTLTQVGFNPTLSPDNRSNTSRFFSNRGAVAAVFTVIGVALVSIALWIYFARRRQHQQRLLESDMAAASAAPARFHRAPLEDEDDNTPLIGGPSSLSRGPRTLDISDPFAADPFNPYPVYNPQLPEEVRSSAPATSDSPVPDDRLNAALTVRMKPERLDSTDSMGPRDEEDYSRPVLGVVRNF